MRIPSYQKYLEEFYKKKQQLAKKGLSMYDATPLTTEELIDTYTALRNDRLEEVRLGKRKATSNLLRDLVNEQAYSTSRRQAINLMKAARTAGIKTSVQELMVDDYKVQSVLREMNDRLKEEGLTSSEIALLIGQEFFGSE